MCDFVEATHTYSRFSLARLRAAEGGGAGKRRREGGWEALSREAEGTPELQTQQERALAVQFQPRLRSRAHTASSPSSGNRSSSRAAAAQLLAPAAVRRQSLPSSALSPQLFPSARLFELWISAFARCSPVFHSPHFLNYSFFILSPPAFFLLKKQKSGISP